MAYINVCFIRTFELLMNVIIEGQIIPFMLKVEKLRILGKVLMGCLCM